MAQDRAWWNGHEMKFVARVKRKRPDDVQLMQRRKLHEREERL